jgi:hypothetical protein
MDSFWLIIKYKVRNAINSINCIIFHPRSFARRGRKSKYGKKEKKKKKKKQIQLVGKRDGTCKRNL